MDSEFDEQFVSIDSSDLSITALPRIISLDIPLTKTTRYVHVALDAYVRVSLADTWRAEGELRFTKFGSPVLTIPIVRGNTPAPNGWATRPSGGGAQQPSLIYELASAVSGYAQNSVEIPCWALQAEADSVSLYVKSLRDDTVSGSTTAWVVGLRIQSQ